MGYRIGLDIGITSVGWAAIEDDTNGKPIRIIDLGSRIFDAAENPKDGAPLSQPRREARGLRRRIRRKEHRIKRTKHLLEKFNIISVKEIEEMYQNYKFEFSPYELRVQALDSKISNKDLARILISLVKKRGYKSNSKAEENSSSDAGKLLTATRENEQLMKEKGYRTVAEMLIKDEKFRVKKLDGSEYIKIKNSQDSYTNTTLRYLLVDEIKLILKTQQQFNEKITDDFIDEYLAIFESQRNFDEGPGEESKYGGNLIENMLGRCTFEKEEFRAPKACYTFEYFKLLQDINHIKIEKLIKNDNDEVLVEKRELSEDERKIIVDLAKDKASLTFASLRNALNLELNERFNMVKYKSSFNITEEDNKESEKARKFQEFESYHKIRKALDKYEKDYILKLSEDNLNDIAYALSIYKNDNKRTDYLKEHISFLSEECIEKLLELNFSKVGNLSIKAMKKINSELEKGMTYDKAVNNVYEDFRGLVKTEKTEKLSLNNLDEKISNPVVRRAVSQTIKVVNAITNKYNPLYGEPDIIVVEFARELSRNRDERNKIEKRQAENRDINDKAKKEIEELGKEYVTGQYIVKYKLWKEQNEICMYSGKHISIEDLFTEAVDVDHIIPYSISFDDSYSNKVLVLSSENRQKGNRIPYQYIKETGKNIKEYQTRVDNFIKNYNKKRKLLKEFLTVDDKNEWKSRNINDTRYITKVIYNLLRNNMKFSDNPNFTNKIWTINGAITAYVRKRLGIEKIRENGDEHHAVDAAVIAVVSQGMVNKITRFSQYMEARYQQNSGEYVDEETGEIISKTEYENKYGTKFPEPWNKFRKELEIRSTCDSRERMEECIKAENIFSYNENEDGINRYDDLEPIFVSRMPRRKVRGQAHLETIRRKIISEEGIKKIEKIELTKLKLKNGDIEGYPESNKKDDKLLYNALLNRLIEFGGDAEKAFAMPFYKPKADGTEGPLVKKVKIESKTTLGVDLKNIKAIADNGSMVRIDVFYVEGEGYYFVPIYVADTIKEKLPNKACVAAKNYNEWKEMDDENFIFSLYPNDLIRIKNSNEITLIGNNNQIETKDFFAYYIKAGISSASLTVINHDNSYTKASLGIKSLDSIEKYQVDVLGNYNKVKTPEKRMKFNWKKGG